MKTLWDIHNELCSPKGCPGRQCQFVVAIENVENAASNAIRRVASDNSHVSEEEARRRVSVSIGTQTV